MTAQKETKEWSPGETSAAQRRARRTKTKHRNGLKGREEARNLIGQPTKTIRPIRNIPWAVQSATRSSAGATVLRSVRAEDNATARPDSGDPAGFRAAVSSGRVGFAWRILSSRESFGGLRLSAVDPLEGEPSSFFFLYQEIRWVRLILLFFFFKIIEGYAFHSSREVEPRCLEETSFR